MARIENRVFDGRLTLTREERLSFAIKADLNHIAYCSEQLDECIAYRRSWIPALEVVKRVPFPDAESNVAALQHFLGLEIPGLFHTSKEAVSSPRPGERGGSFRSEPGIWQGDLVIESRSEIRKLYQSAVPGKEQLAGIEKALKGYIKDSNYKELVLKCFRETDPAVTVFGRREDGDSNVISLVWDPWEEEWITAAVIAREGDPYFMQARGDVLSAPCLTVR